MKWKFYGTASLVCVFKYFSVSLVCVRVCINLFTYPLITYPIMGTEIFPRNSGFINLLLSLCQFKVGARGCVRGSWR